MTKPPVHISGNTEEEENLGIRQFGEALGMQGAQWPPPAVSDKSCRAGGLGLDLAVPWRLWPAPPTLPAPALLGQLVTHRDSCLPTREMHLFPAQEFTPQLGQLLNKASFLPLSQFRVDLSALTS